MCKNVYAFEPCGTASSKKDDLLGGKEEMGVK